MNSRTLAIAAIGLIAVVGGYLATNTRLGAYIVMDVVGGVGAEQSDYNPETGPLTLTRILKPIRTIPLPAEVEQPSGIQHRGDKVYISTDQAELFVFDGNISSLSERVNLLGGPLLFKQGMLEGIEFDEEKLFAVGEFGAIRVWERANGAWNRIDDKTLPHDVAEVEYSGITHFSGRRLATSEDSPVVIDLDSGAVHTLNFGPFLKPGADPSTLQFSGLAAEDDKLYVLTEAHSCILALDPVSFTVRQVFGIVPGPVADIAVRDGHAYVVVDHNYAEEKPPLYVYAIGRSTTGYE